MAIAMANTLSLKLQSTPFALKLHHSNSSISHHHHKSTCLLRDYPIRFTSLKNFHKPSINPKPLKNITLKCSAKTTPYDHYCSKTQLGHSTNVKENQTSITNPPPYASLRDTISTALEALTKPMIMAIMAVGLLLMYVHPFSAWAATGGRMGGRSFSSSSSSSSSSYGSSSSSYSTPHYSSSSSSSGSDTKQDRQLSDFDKVAARVLISAMILTLMTPFLLFAWVEYKRDAVKTTVIKLQVGLSGTAQSLQSNLNQIATSADTSTQQGLRYILSETLVALLRHSDHWISAYSCFGVEGSISKGEKMFDKLSIEERGKIDEETLVNVDNIKKHSPKRMKATGSRNEYIVVTILVAAEGEYEVAAVESSMDLTAALKKLGSIRSRNIKGVEVLWTPQDENDILTERELLEKYALLRPI